jgi:hypothetical protein
MDVFDVGSHTPEKVQGMLGSGKGISGVQSNAKMGRADGLAEPEQFFGSEVLMILNGKADARKLRYRSSFTQGRQYFLKKGLPATRQWPPITADFCASNDGTHSSSTQTCSQFLRMVASGRESDEETMFASIASQCRATLAF